MLRLLVSGIFQPLAIGNDLNLTSIVPQTLERQSHVRPRDIARVEAQEVDNQAVRQEATTELQHVDRNLSISTARDILDMKGHALLASIKATVAADPPDNVPTAKQMEQLRDLAAKLDA